MTGAREWDPAQLPDQHGRTFVVTGGNAGIGYFAAEQLARAGGQVVIAARNPDRVRAAQDAIRDHAPDVLTRFVRFDLTSLASVRDAAAELAGLPHLDAVILNAGVMTAPKEGETTKDGFWPLIGGYLANFAFIAHLLNRAGPDRIIQTTSNYARSNIDVRDLTAPPGPTMREYGRSKTATEIFGFELDRRLRAAGRAVDAIMSRPGMAVDARTPRRPGIARKTRWDEPLWGFVGQSKEHAAWSAVRAATDPDAHGGDFFGPAHGTFGPPVRIAPEPRLAKPLDDLAGRLWEQSEQLTGVTMNV
ncbi:SDR family NAD(P)-dependent oxidoreductase [Leifsonia sp. ZF2019]|uniref:SDR family NAD(P)-dependent oxidoreductase n=1 Tax=Leifsonia sp. ZF2019 TaxID=2781978 RepID=UPI001CBAEBC8|nr:SDR family NAD(P)-dependent oxidoreductase [Leifsonia sp. ZF2019]UAJ79323.1 SDR family NAD(P)-dependent oxidoreductase [Leifsonia sp. ZF2019]